MSERYASEVVPNEYDPAFFEREFYKLAAAFVASREVEVYNVAPEKVYDGLMVLADGTNWNPGSGQGVYCYYNGMELSRIGGLMEEVSFGGVQADQIDLLWPMLEPLVRKPLARLEALHKVQPEHVRARLLTRDYQCWIVLSSPDKIDACLITYIDVFPTGYKELVVFLVGGSGLDAWGKVAGETLLAFAKEHDCQALRGIGRKGWMRAFEHVFPGHTAKPELSFTFEV